MIRARLVPLLFVLGLLAIPVAPVEATFSIVAVDLETGEVGSAGASCVPDVSIIRDLVAGVGAINTQALYEAGNQNRARTRMLAGDTPEEIMEYLRNNDVRGRPQQRQYGAVTLAGGGRSASFTGANTISWAGHRTGRTYAIQGNILAGPEVVDDMEAAYLATRGLPLEERLMAVLQAAKRPGADTRCFPVSAQSAYLSVKRVNNVNNFFVNLRGRRNQQIDPIDNLQERYDTWKANRRDIVDVYRSEVRIDRRSLPADGRSSTMLLITPRNRQDERLRDIERVVVLNTGGGSVSRPMPLPGSHRGRFVVRVTSAPFASLDELRVFVDEGRGFKELQPPVLIRYNGAIYR